jgi:hypothetical protein
LSATVGAPAPTLATPRRRGLLWFQALGSSPSLPSLHPPPRPAPHPTPCQGKRDAAVREWVSHRTTATPDPAAWGRAPPVPAPGGHEGAAHEAGYDAYMTGAVFGRLLWLLSLDALQGRNRWLLPDAPRGPPDASLAQAHAWRTTFARSRCEARGA